MGVRGYEVLRLRGIGSKPVPASANSLLFLIHDDAARPWLFFRLGFLRGHRLVNPR